MRRGRRTITVVVGVLILAGASAWYLSRGASVRAEEQKLRAAVKGATLLRVRSGGTCHRDKQAEKVLLEETDTAALEALVSRIHFTSMTGQCACCGDPTLEFYRGGQQVAMLGFHHARSLRWPESWQNDGNLSAESRDFIIKWLADRGVSGPREDIEREATAARAMQRKVARATRGFSPDLRQAFEESDSEFASVLRRELGQPEQQARVLFQVLGASNDSWTSLDWVEQRADDLLRKVDPQALAGMTEQALRGADRQIRRGAARFWMSWRSPLESWHPANERSLHRVVLIVQRECRYYPERISALQNLQQWHRELDAEEVTQSLRMGLCDPQVSVRRQAMLVAGKLKHRQSTPHLRDVLAGKTVQITELPSVPAEEQEDVPQGFDGVASGAPEREVAALALGWMGDIESLPVLRARQSEPMCRVGIAMLGQPEVLVQEDFQCNNQALQLAAVEAVVRCRGKVGLNLAINYSQATHWWEEEHVAKRLQSMLMENTPPGIDELQASRTLKDLRAWFRKYAEAYLASIPK